MNQLNKLLSRISRAAVLTEGAPFAFLCPAHRPMRTVHAPQSTRLSGQPTSILFKMSSQNFQYTRGLWSAKKGEPNQRVNHLMGYWKWMVETKWPFTQSVSASWSIHGASTGWLVSICTGVLPASWSSHGISPGSLVVFFFSFFTTLDGPI